MDAERSLRRAARCVRLMTARFAAERKIRRVEQNSEPPTAVSSSGLRLEIHKTGWLRASMATRFDPCWPKADAVRCSGSSAAPSNVRYRARQRHDHRSRQFRGLRNRPRSRAVELSANLPSFPRGVLGSC